MKPTQFGSIESLVAYMRESPTSDTMIVAAEAIEQLQREIGDANHIIKRRNAAIRMLEADIEAIGAGGVDGRKLVANEHLSPLYGSPDRIKENS